MGKHVAIIGAGVSGLVAAIELEKAGHRVTLMDQRDAVGGRLQTDSWEGLPLDHGFQVLLSAYPAVKEYLDLDAMDCSYFTPGAMIYANQKHYRIGDPRRNLGLLLPTLLAPIGSLGDKLKILKLSNALRQLDPAATFDTPPQTTMSYLQQYGFSYNIIQHFFQPFFSGIFLEPKLDTPSGLFRFVYKMFTEGKAALPKAGIAAVPQYLAAQLKQSTIRLQTAISKVEEGRVHLQDGTALAADAIIVATVPNKLLPGYQAPNVQWKSTLNLYFTAPATTISDRMIGLLAAKDTVVNNFHFVNQVIGSGKPLLSVTVVDPQAYAASELQHQVEKEMASHCGISGLHHVQTYHVERALPDLSQVTYQPDEKSIRHANGLYLCGDHLANGSLNAAMLSGKMAAQAVNQDFSIAG